MYPQKVLVVPALDLCIEIIFMFHYVPFDFHNSLSALPELHLKIARSNDDCMDQLSNLTLTPSVGISSVLLVGIIFLCIAYTPETHSYLAKPHVIERLLKGCSRYSQNDDVLILK